MKCCQWCFDELVRREDESDYQWNKRKHCNRQHAMLHSASKRGK